jgi:hypothetical protein
MRHAAQNLRRHQAGGTPVFRQAQQELRQSTFVGHLKAQPFAAERPAVFVFQRLYVYTLNIRRIFLFLGRALQRRTVQQVFTEDAAIKMFGVFLYRIRDIDKQKVHSFQLYIDWDYKRLFRPTQFYDTLTVRYIFIHLA